MFRAEFLKKFYCCFLLDNSCVYVRHGKGSGYPRHFFFHFKKKLNIWVNLIKNVVLVSGLQQSNLVTHLHIFRLPCWPRQQRIFLQCRRPRFSPWVWKIPWRREWPPTPVFLPEEFRGQRSLPGYSPCGRKESDMTEQLTHTSSSEISPNDKFHSSACPSWVWCVVKGVSHLSFHCNTIFREHTPQSERVGVSEGQLLAQWPWKTHLN